MLTSCVPVLRCAALAAVLGCAAGAAMGQYATNPDNCHTYLLTPDASTWSAAEAYAQSRGAHLATIRSLSEQAWINSTFLVGADATHAFWIGLHRVAPGGTFAWSSGEASSFANWHANEPNNTCGGEPAVAMNWYISESQPGNPGDWNDTNDGGVHYANCGSAGQVPYRGLVEFTTFVAFSTQPAPASACPGSTAPFSVAVVGAGPTSFRWQIATNGADWATLGNDPLPLACGGSAHASPFDGSNSHIGVTPCPGLNTDQVRCVVTTPCGDTYSDPTTLTLVACTCSADFNNDGDVGTDADIDAFFACLGGNCCATCGSADFNGDGDVGTDADIESFFRVLGGGPC
jgi:hypothetical protein